MTTPLTGNEPYYPIVGMNHQSTGITIRQKFISDYIASRSSASEGEVNFSIVTAKAEKAFQVYLKIINGE